MTFGLSFDVLMTFLLFVCPLLQLSCRKYDIEQEFSDDMEYFTSYFRDALIIGTAVAIPQVLEICSYGNTETMVLTVAAVCIPNILFLLFGPTLLFATFLIQLRLVCFANIGLHQLKTVGECNVHQWHLKLPIRLSIILSLFLFYFLIPIQKSFYWAIALFVFCTMGLIALGISIYCFIEAINASYSSVAVFQNGSILYFTCICLLCIGHILAICIFNPYVSPRNWIAKYFTCNIYMLSVFLIALWFLSRKYGQNSNSIIREEMKSS